MTKTNKVFEIYYRKWEPDGETYKVSLFLADGLVRGENQVEAVTRLRDICREQGHEIEIQDITYLGELMEEVKKIATDPEFCTCVIRRLAPPDEKHYDRNADGKWIQCKICKKDAR